MGVTSSRDGESPLAKKPAPQKPKTTLDEPLVVEADKQGKYQVIVGNVGTVYSGNSFMDALKEYGAYKRIVRHSHGSRAYREEVIFMEDGDIKWEYDPTAKKKVRRGGKLK